MITRLPNGATVVEGVPQPLREANPGYTDVDGITRYWCGGESELYCAVHIVGSDFVAQEAADYSVPHRHSFPEINILAAAPGALVYSIVLDDSVRRVTSPACIYIPPGVLHSANAIDGAGAFVTVRLGGERGPTFTPVPASP